MNFFNFRKCNSCPLPMSWSPSKLYPLLILILSSISLNCLIILVQLQCGGVKRNVIRFYIFNCRKVLRWAVVHGRNRLNNVKVLLQIYPKLHLHKWDKVLKSWKEKASWLWIRSSPAQSPSLDRKGLGPPTHFQRASAAWIRHGCHPPRQCPRQNQSILLAEGWCLNRKLFFLVESNHSFRSSQFGILFNHCRPT